MTTGKRKRTHKLSYLVHHRNPHLIHFLFTSYFASLHAQHSSKTFDMKSCWASSSSQNSLVNFGESIYQTSRFSTIVARKVTQPLPDSGAIQITCISSFGISDECVATLPQINFAIFRKFSSNVNVPCFAGEKSYVSIIIFSSCNKQIDVWKRMNRRKNNRKISILTSANSDGMVDFCSTAKKNPENLGFPLSRLENVLAVRSMKT